MSEPITNKPADYKPYEPKWYDIMYWKLKQVKYWFYDVITGFQNLWTWKSVIWNDRQYDSAFLQIIIDKKMSLMIEDSDRWLEIENDTRKQTMIEFRDLLRHVFSSDVHEFVKQEQQQFEQQYGELDTWETKCEGPEELYQLHFSYSKCKDQQTTDQANQRSIELHKLNDQRFEQAFDRCMKVFKENARKWWD